MKTKTNYSSTIKRAFFVLLCFTLAINVKAQTADKKWNIGLSGGISQYRGDLGNGFYHANNTVYGFGGISVSRYFVKHVDFALEFTKGEIGYKRDNIQFHTPFTTGTFNFRFNILGDDALVNPYIFVGGGAMIFAKDLTVDKKYFEYAAPSFGGGIHFHLSPVIMLNLQETFMYSTNDTRDGLAKGVNDAYLFHSAGLSFNFGNKKDEDKDGVADRKDKCPATPAKIAVDKMGCPVDKDKDGVADYLDECPDVAGTVALKGCPDKDGDGVADKNDQCPDVAGTMALMGCMIKMVMVLQIKMIVARMQKVRPN